MSQQSQTAQPGQTAAQFSHEANIYWGGQGDSQRLFASGVINEAAVDAGNTPTTTLRAGLLMGKITASGELVQWVDAAIDGSGVVYGVLDDEVEMLQNGAAAKQFNRVSVSAPVRASQLLIEGVALVGATDEVAARTDLNSKRFYIDDEFV